MTQTVSEIRKILPQPAHTGAMKAAMLAGPRRFEIAEIPVPEPGPGQVRIKLQGCGVCHSSEPAWQGRPWFNYPMDPGAMGHEGWGIVDAVGEGVYDTAPGDRVAALSYNAYAEYDLASCDSLVTLPQALEGRPFPGEPLGCAINIFRRSDIRAGQTVAIVGIGFLGALCTQLALDAGARVLAISRREFPLRLAERFGATPIVMDDQERIFEQVKFLTGGAMCERVIEAVGLQQPLDLASALTAERGALIIAGFHQDGPRQVDMQSWNWRGIDVINAHERNPSVYIEGMRDAVEAVVDGVLDPRPLLTHAFSLDTLPVAFEMMEHRPDGFLKGYIAL